MRWSVIRLRCTTQTLISLRPRFCSPSPSSQPQSPSTFKLSVICGCRVHSCRPLWPKPWPTLSPSPPPFSASSLTTPPKTQRLPPESWATMQRYWTSPSFPKSLYTKLGLSSQENWAETSAVSTLEASNLLKRSKTSLLRLWHQMPPSSSKPPINNSSNINKNQTFSI